MRETSARAAAARATRRRIVEAAHALFLDRGYRGTTIRAVADRAGVSAETVYKTFGGKAGLLKAAYDVAMAGDDEPVPIAERPEGRASRDAASPREAAAAYADLARLLSTRAGPLTQVVLAGQGADAAVAEFARVTDSERLAGATFAVGHWAERGWLREGLDPERARDLLWMVTSPSVYALALERGWTTEEYRDWIADALMTQVLDVGADH